MSKNDENAPLHYEGEDDLKKGGVHLSKGLYVTIGAVVVIIVMAMMYGIASKQKEQREASQSQGKYAEQGSNSMEFVIESDGIIGAPNQIPGWENNNLNEEKKGEEPNTNNIPLNTPKDPWTYLTNDPNNLKETPEQNKKVDAPQMKLQKAEGISKAQQMRLDRYLQALETPTEVRTKTQAIGNTSNNPFGTNNPTRAQVREFLGTNNLAQAGEGQQQSNQPLAISEDDPNGQLAKNAFASRERNGRGYIETLPIKSRSPYELRAGTLIPAVLQTKIVSDLPGQILAQVAQDIRDSTTGDHVLIPAGSKIVGSYDSQILFGQKRILVVWDRINLPDGRIIDMGTQPGTDREGAAGLKDQVDNKFFERFGAAFMVAIFSGAVNYITESTSDDSEGDDGETSPSEAVSTAIAQQMGQLGLEIVRKYLDVQPTLTARTGLKFNVFLTKDAIIPINEGKGKP